MSPAMQPRTVINPAGITMSRYIHLLLFSSGSYSLWAEFVSAEVEEVLLDGEANIDYGFLSVCS